METDIIQKQAAMRETVEDDKRIAANIRKGEAELKVGLGTRFKNADDFIEHLVNL